MRAIVWETAPQIALRNCSKQVAREGQYIFNFDKGGVLAIKHLSLQRFSASHEELMSPKGLSTFLDMRIGLIKPVPKNI